MNEKSLTYKVRDFFVQSNAHDFLIILESQNRKTSAQMIKDTFFFQQN